MPILTKNQLKIRTIATVIAVIVFWIIIFVHTFMAVFAPMFGPLGKPIFETLSGAMAPMTPAPDMTAPQSMMTIISDNVRALDIIMFAATILLGIFLISSVAKEARQRLKLEAMDADLRYLNANLDQKVKEQTQELREKNEHLEGLMAAKTEFISVAAHELRTPLTAIKWIVQLLYKDTAGNFKPEQTEQIGKLHSIVDKMVSLVGDILNVSRIEEGRFGSTLVKQDIGPLVQSALATADVNAQAKKVKLVKNLPPTLPAVLADEERLKLSLENIIGNAIKYTPADGQVTVTAATGAGNLTITVADTGIGVAPADQSRLFDKFFRATNALKYDTEGTGLGLYIARNIIEAHHGQIAFNSALDKGTTFTITLPVAN